MRKLLSLSTALLTWLVTMMAFSAHAAPVKIYVKASAAPNLYVWSDIDGTLLNGGWPGATMNETTTIAGETWYVSPAAYENAKAIISDGSGQTGDIVVTKDNNMFVYGGASDCHPVNYRDDGVFAYAVDNNGWSTMYAYAWKGEETNSSWPGQQMTLAGFKDGHGVYLWTANDLPFVPENVIFTNNQGQQTNDLSFVNGSFYETSAVVNDRCDATENSTYPLLAIDEAHFPDANFRALLGSDFYTHTQVAAYTNKGYHPDKRNTVVPHWSDQDMQDLAGAIKNLDGIQYLKNLQHFIIRGGELEGTIDISKNKSLIEFECTDNFVENLIVGNLPELDELTCHYNRISSIDLSGVPNLTDLNLFVNELTSFDMTNLYKLKYLRLAHNHISSITYGNEPYTEIRDIMVSYNNLTEFDISRYPNLEALAINENPGLSGFTIPEGSTMNMLVCNGCNLSSLALENCPDLGALLAYDNPLTSIDLSNVPSLNALDIYNTNIVNLDLSHTPYLMYFKMRNPHVVSTTKDFNENSVFLGTPGWQDDDIEYGVISPNGRTIASPQAMVCNGDAVYYYELTGDNGLTNVVGDGFNTSNVASYTDATVVQAGQALAADAPSYVQNIDPFSLTGDILVLDPTKTQFTCTVNTGFESGLSSASPAPRFKSPIRKDSSDDDDIIIDDPTTLNTMFETAEIQLSYELPELPAEPVDITFSPVSGSTVRYGRPVTIEAPELGTWGTDYEIFYTLDGTDPENTVNYDSGGSTYKYKGGISINNDDGTVATAIRAKAYQSSGIGVSVVGEATYSVMQQLPMAFERITSVEDLEPGKRYLFVGDDEELDEDDQPTGVVTTYAAGFDKFEDRYQYHALESATDFTKDSGIICLTPYYYVEPYIMSEDGNGKYLFTNAEDLQITVVDDEESEMYGLTLSSSGTPAAISFDNDGFAVVNFDGFANGLMAMNYGKRVDFLVYTGNKDEDTRKIQIWKERPAELTFSVPSGSTVRYARQVLPICESLGTFDEDFDVYYTIDGSDPVAQETENCFLIEPSAWEREPFINAQTSGQTIRARAFHIDRSTWQYDNQVSQIAEVTYTLLPQEELTFEKISSVNDLEAGAKYLLMLHGREEHHGEIEEYYIPASFEDVQTREATTLLHSDWVTDQPENGSLTLSPYYRAEVYTLSGNATDGWQFTSTEGLQIIPQIPTGEPEQAPGHGFRESGASIGRPEGELDLTLAQEGGTADITFDENGYATIVFEGFTGRVAFQNDDDDGFVYRPASSDDYRDDVRYIELWKEKSTTAEATPDIASGTALHYGQPIVLSYDGRAEGDKFYYTTDGSEPAVGGATTRNCYFNNWFLATVTGTYKFLFTDSEGTPKATGEAAYSILDDQRHVYAKMVTSEDDLIAGEKYFIISGEYTEDVTINDVHYDKLFVPNYGATPFAEPRNDNMSVGRKGLYEYKESDTDYFDFEQDLTKGDNDCQLEVMSLEHLDMIDVHDRFSTYINHYFIEPYTLGGQAGAWTMTNTLGTSLYSDGQPFTEGSHKYHLSAGNTASPMTIAFAADGEAIIQINGKTLVDDDMKAFSLTSRNVADYSEVYPPLRLFRVYKGIPVTLTEFIETTPDIETTYVIDEDLTVMLVREDVEWHETTDNGHYEGEGWGLLVLRDNAQAVAPYYSTPSANQEIYTIEGKSVMGGDQAEYRQNNWLHYSLHDYTGENGTHKHIDMSAYKTGDVIKAGTLMGIHWTEGPLMAAYTTTDDYTWPEKRMNGEEAVEGDTTLNLYCPANFLLENLNWNDVAGTCKYFFMTPKNFEVAKMTWAVYDEMEVGGETVRGFFVPQSSTDQTGDNETITHNGADLNGGVMLAWMNSMCQGTYTDEGNNEVGIAKDTQPSAIFKKGTAYEMTVWVGFAGEVNPDYELTDEAQPVIKHGPSRIAPKNNKASANFVVFPVSVQAKGSIVTGVDKIADQNVAKAVKAVHIYNVAGIELRQLQPGVNIVVTEYTDGTTSTAKMLK